MRTQERIPTGDYRVTFAAYCGMAYPIEEGLSLVQARRTAARLLRHRRRTGHPIAVLASGTEYECQEPADCAMVPDTAGYLSIVEETAPAVRCWDCDELCKIGDYHECDRGE